MNSDGIVDHEAISANKEAIKTVEEALKAEADTLKLLSYKAQEVQYSVID